MSLEDRLARSVALEQAYVHDVYEQFSDNTRSRPWPRVQQFLENLEAGSIVCDVGEVSIKNKKIKRNRITLPCFSLHTGCGNGKYLNVNSSIFNMGGDKSIRLCEMTREKSNEVSKRAEKGWSESGVVTGFEIFFTLPHKRMVVLGNVLLNQGICQRLLRQSL